MAETGAAGYFTPNSSMVGLSPNQLRYGAPGLDPSKQFGGRIDELAAALGIGEQTPLENKAYALVTGAGQPAEYIRSQFKTTDPYQGAYDALGASKGITEQAYSERGRQLEAEKAPLNERYKALIDELTRRETKETGAQSTALAREYGKRGVPLSSGAYEQDLLGKTGDISQFYGGQRTTVGLENADKLREISNQLAMLPIEKARELNEIDKIIAQKKAEGATQQLQMALQMYRDQKENEWRQKDYDLRQQEVKFGQQLQSSQLSYEQKRQPLELGLLQEQLNAARFANQPRSVASSSPGPFPTTTGNIANQFSKGAKPKYTPAELEMINKAPANWRPSGY